MKICVTKGIRSLFVIIFMLLSICLTSPAQSAEDGVVITDDQSSPPQEEVTTVEGEEPPSLPVGENEPLAAAAIPTIRQPDYTPNYGNTEIMPKVDLNTGALTSSLPIQTPPGRGGIAVPNIAMTYSSQRKNGLCGMGWDLNIPFIQRSTKKGLNYNVNNLMLNGSSELMETTAGDYREKIEGSFTKYHLDGSGFTATTREGTKYVYGQTQSNSGRTFKWLLTKIIDPNENTLTIAYWENQGQLYPSSMQYSGNKMEFERESRTDVLTNFQSGWKVVTSYRIKNIKIFANTDNFLTYTFNYDNGNSTKFSRLTKIDITSQPSIIFTYKNGGSGNFSTYAIDTPLSPDYLINYAYFTCDVNGDGLLDFLRRPGSITTFTQIKAHISSGNGHFSNGTIWGSIPASYNQLPAIVGDFDGTRKADILFFNRDQHLLYIHFADSYRFSWAFYPGNYYFETYTADINGDGGDELIIHYGNSLEIYHFIHNSFMLDVKKWQFTLNSSSFLRFADVNGDGLSDIIQHESNTSKVIVYTASGDSSLFHSGQTLNLTTAQGTLHIADINGDGLTDIVHHEIGYNRASAYLSKGDGTFDTPQTLSFDVGWPFMTLADINGDGYSDLVYFDSHKDDFYIYYSKGDGTFGNRASKHISGIYTAQSTVNISDTNKDGLSDLIFLEFKLVDDPLGVRYEYRFFNFLVDPESPDVPTDVLIGINNGVGATTSISYQSSDNFSKKYLPFKVNMVTDVTTNPGGNGVSSTSYYDYAGSLFDIPSREFRGFETVTLTNPNGTKETTKFFQDDILKGRIEWARLRASDNTDLSYTINSWETTNVGNGSTFVKLASTRTDHYFNPTVSVLDEYEYNNEHGGVTKQTKYSTTDIVTEKIINEKSYINKNTWCWRVEQETLKGSSDINKILRQTDYMYDNKGNMTKKTSWWGENPSQSPYTEIAYDSHGNPVSITDAKGNPPTTIDYDTLSYAFPVKTEAPQTTFAGLPVNHITKALSYDYRCGKPTQIRDENGNVTNYEYDALGRLTKVMQPDGGQVSYFYNDVAPRYITTRTLEANNQYIEKTEKYDGLNRKYQTIVDGAYGDNGEKKSIVSNIYYDNMGRIWKEEGPYYDGGQSPFVKKEFDLFGRVIWIRSPENESDDTGNVVTGISYDGFNTITIDPDLKKKREIKDYLGRITSIIEDYSSANYTTNYAYNAAGDLCTITDHESNVITMAYDTLGRKTSMSHPDLGYWTYTYDKNNNLRTQTDAKNQVITFDYDALNRMISKQYSTGQIAVFYIYDNLDLPNGIGRLYATIQDTNPAALKGYKTENTYDVAGKTTSVLYPDSTRFNYQYYPGTGLLKEVLGVDGAVYANLCLYEPTGKIGQVTSGNNVRTRYTYDGKSTRLTGIVTQDQANVILQDRSYTYSRAGDITNIQDDVKSITYTYAYDNLHRLLSETPNTGSYQPVSYTYSPTGNILTKTLGAQSFTYAYTLAKKHAVSRITYAGNPYDYFYDPNGNMTQGPDFTNLNQITQRRAAYDTDNMPTQVWAQQSGVTTYFSYDGDGDRVKKTTSVGAAIYYVGDHYEVKNDEPLKYIFAGNLRLIMIKGTNTFYYHKDHLNSTSVITDNSGGVVETTQYEPFGATRDHTGQDLSGYKFTDQELDNETNLYNYDARLYDPVIGRFGTADSIMQDAYDPQSLNTYAYCRNNPLIYTDPSGHVSSGSDDFVSDYGKAYFNYQTDYYLYDDPLLGFHYDTGRPIDTEASDMVMNSALDFIPGLGDGKGIVEAWYGRDALGNKLSWWERGLSFACLSELRGLSKGDEIAGLFKAPKSTEGFTNLYRAVGPEELSDIHATGAFRNLGSAEGKYFTTSAEAASSYAKQAYRGFYDLFGDQPYTLVQTRVPKSIFTDLTPASVDRGIPAWVIPNNRLPGLIPKVLDYMPVP